MKKVFVLLLMTLFISVAANAKEDVKAASGEALFNQNCSPCHPGGGNIINPAFTLHKKDREAHGVKTVNDIVEKMRNPGPGMTKFEKTMLSDKDAKAIAEYILKTFD